MRMIGVVCISLNVLVRFVMASEPCREEDLQARMKGLPQIYTGEPNETRIPHYKQLATSIGSDCLPVLIQRLISPTEPSGRKVAATVMTGIAGIKYDASAAVPELIRIIQSAGGNGLDSSEINRVFQTHVALARIATEQARDFLIKRAKGLGLQQIDCFWPDTISTNEIPAEVYTRGMALQCLGYLGDDAAEDFLLKLLQTEEFRKGGKFYDGVPNEGDLRWQVLSALRLLPSERALKNGIRDYPVSHQQRAD